MRLDNLPDKLKIEEQDGHQNGFTDDVKALSNGKNVLANSESASLQKRERLKTINSDDSMSGLSFKGTEIAIIRLRILAWAITFFLIDIVLIKTFLR